MSTVAHLLDGGRFSAVEPVTAGWSDDRKYRVTAPDGARYLLRISPIEHTDRRRREFELMQHVAALGVPMCLPVEIGTSDDGVYLLLSWIDGEDLRPALPHLPQAVQRGLGETSGRLLRTIHSLEAPPGMRSWSERFNAKIDAKLRMYADSELHFDGDEHVLRYVRHNRHLLEGRPQTFHHGDYHDGNMMLEDGELRIIDFDRADVGDPWEELNRIVWSAKTSPEFASGQLRGYFDGDPPEDFFRLLALYIATNTLSSVPWAARFAPAEIDTMLEQARDVLIWYDDMSEPVPTWYIPTSQVPG